MCGAISYAELALMFPRSSGEYNFLRRIYHPAFGFVAGWLSATVGFAAPVALAAMAFSVYFRSVMPDAPLPWPGLVVVWLVSLVHLSGIRHGSAFQNVWTAIKLLLIVAFLLSGLVFGSRQPISFAPGAGDLSFITSAPFAISLVFVMYSYSGWNAATYIIGEIADPNRSLPRALFLGTAIVIVAYVGLNAVFLAVTPMQELAGPARRRHDRRQPHVRRVRRPRRRHVDLHRTRLLHQRHDVDRPPRHHDDGRGHAAAAGFFAQIEEGRAGGRDRLSAPGLDLAAVDRELRGGARFHPVQPHLLLLLHGAGRHQAAHHPTEAGAAVSRLALSGDAARFSRGDAVDDVLSRRQSAIAIARGLRNDALRPCDLRRISSVIEGRIFGQLPNHRLPNHRLPNRLPTSYELERPQSAKNEICRSSRDPAGMVDSAGGERRDRHSRRHGAIPGWPQSLCGLAPGGADQGCSLAAARELFELDLRTAGTKPPGEGPRVLQSAVGHDPRHHALHVQRPGCPARRRAFFRAHPTT